MNYAANKKFHVYGIGNALVDMEFEVSDGYLQKMMVEKGVMTLVEEERQTELLSHLQSSPHKRACGGSAANTIIAVASLGGKSFYSCKVASDEAGDFYYNDLTAHGVATNLGPSRASGKTGKCMVFVTEDAERTMNTYLGITANFGHDELVLNEIAASEYLYIEGYLVTAPNAREAAIAARNHAQKSGVKTALTFSDPSMTSYFRDGLEEMIGGDGVDLLFCNETEAMQFTGTDTIAKAALALKKYARSFAITMGPRGALLFDGTHELEVVAPKVDPVDSNGAGDLFAGAFLYGITHGLNFNDAGRLATTAAAELVTKFGPRLPAKRLVEIKNSLF